MPCAAWSVSALALALSAILSAGPADADSVRVGDIVVGAPWSRATPGGAPVAGGYLTITNEGSQPDRLIGGSVTVAERFEVHTMEIVDGVMRMAPVDGSLEIPPGETVTLAPGGLHAMMMGLRRPLVAGDAVSGTLVFEHAGEVAIIYAVAPLGAREAPAAHSGHGSHAHHGSDSGGGAHRGHAAD